MSKLPFLWLLAGALLCWWLFGRKVTATVSIGNGVQVGNWRLDPLGNVGTAAGDTNTTTGG